MLCSWYQAKQWVDTSLNQYSRFSLICIVLLSESFWTASNDTYVLRMRWINSSVLKSVLQDSLEALCLKYLKRLTLCLLLLVWLSASLLDWLRQVELLRSSWVLDSLRLNSSQNFEIEYSSWIRILILSIQVESRCWYQVLTWILDSTRQDMIYYY